MDSRMHEGLPTTHTPATTTTLDDENDDDDENTGREGKEEEGGREGDGREGRRGCFGMGFDPYKGMRNPTNRYETTALGKKERRREMRH